jgi:hypothetical protein
MDAVSRLVHSPSERRCGYLYLVRSSASATSQAIEVYPWRVLLVPSALVDALVTVSVTL